MELLGILSGQEEILVVRWKLGSGSVSVASAAHL